MLRYLRSFLLLALLFLGNISLGLSAEKNYVPGELIIKLAPGAAALSVHQLNSLSEMPASVRDLAKFLGTKEVRPFFRGKMAATAPDASAEGKRSAQENKMARRQKILQDSGVDRIYKLYFDTTEDLESVARQFMSDPNIEFAEPNYYVYAFLAANDVHYVSGEEWHIDRISCTGGWDVTTGNSLNVVAVIDSGIRTTHDDLKNKLWINPAENGGVGGVDDDGNGYVDDINGWNFVSNNADLTDVISHGSHVSGIIAAETNNLIGIAGIDWNAKLMTLKVMYPAIISGQVVGVTDWSYVSAAIYYAIAKGADVVNMSLGGTGRSSLVEGACRTAYAANMVLVAAMGNDGDSRVNYPAGFDEVIGVGSVSQSDQRSSFSTYGSGSQITELCAPGESIYSTSSVNNTAYAIGSGTSFAAPMVSALASLLLAEYPTMSVSEIRERMHLTAVDLGSSGPDKYYGFGRINVEAALKGTISGGKGLEISQMMNFPNPANEDGTSFSFYLNDYATITIKVYTLHGELIKTIDGGITNGTYHKVSWDCKDDKGDTLPNGSYIYVVIAEGGQKDKTYKKGKMAMLK